MFRCFCVDKLKRQIQDAQRNVHEHNSLDVDERLHNSRTAKMVKLINLNEEVEKIEAANEKKCLNEIFSRKFDQLYSRRYGWGIPKREGCPMQ